MVWAEHRLKANPGTGKLGPLSGGGAGRSDERWISLYFLATRETRRKVETQNFAAWLGPEAGSRQTQERGNLGPLLAEGQDEERWVSLYLFGHPRNTKQSWEAEFCVLGWAQNRLKADPGTGKLAPFSGGGAGKEARWVSPYLLATRQTRRKGFCAPWLSGESQPRPRRGSWAPSRAFVCDSGRLRLAKRLLQGRSLQGRPSQLGQRDNTWLRKQANCSGKPYNLDSATTPACASKPIAQGSPCASQIQFTRAEVSERSAKMTDQAWLLLFSADRSTKPPPRSCRSKQSSPNQRGREGLS